MDCSCPKCGSNVFKRNGTTRHGKQNNLCLECGRQFSVKKDKEYVIKVDSDPSEKRKI